MSRGAAELTEDRPELAAAVTPLLDARVAIAQQIADLDRKVMGLARNNAQAQQLMTAPGIGPVTPLCFLATIDDPSRWSRSVGAYVGLTTRRYASGEIDWTGRISKCGDKRPEPDFSRSPISYLVGAGEPSEPYTRWRLPHE
jgi:transposase